MKEDKTVQKSNILPKPVGVKTILDYNNNKYKNKSQIIMEQY